MPKTVEEIKKEFKGMLENLYDKGDIQGFHINDGKFHNKIQIEVMLNTSAKQLEINLDTTTT